MAFLRKLAADDTGTSAMEYGVICALMVIGLVTAIQSLGASVVTNFSNTETAMQNANAG